MRSKLTSQYESDTCREANLLSLYDLQKYQQAIIEDITKNKNFGVIDSIVTQRLNDLGFLPNMPVSVIAKGLFGKPPYAVQLGTGVQFSLRKDELKKIRCRV